MEKPHEQATPAGIQNHRPGYALRFSAFRMPPDRPRLRAGSALTVASLDSAGLPPSLVRCSAIRTNPFLRKTSSPAIQGSSLSSAATPQAPLRRRDSRSRCDLPLSPETFPGALVFRPHPVPADLRPVGIVRVQSQFPDALTQRHKILIPVWKKISALGSERSLRVFVIREPAVHDGIHRSHVHYRTFIVSIHPFTSGSRARRPLGYGQSDAPGSRYESTARTPAGKEASGTGARTYQDRLTYRVGLIWAQRGCVGGGNMFRCGCIPADFGWKSRAIQPYCRPLRQPGLQSVAPRVTGGVRPDCGFIDLHFKIILLYFGPSLVYNSPA